MLLLLFSPKNTHADYARAFTNHGYMPKCRGIDTRRLMNRFVNNVMIATPRGWLPFTAFTLRYFLQVLTDRISPMMARGYVFFNFNLTTQWAGCESSLSA
jgi:hypothetical protein